eukprot:gene6842-8486_t
MINLFKRQYLIISRDIQNEFTKSSLVIPLFYQKNQYTTTTTTTNSTDTIKTPIPETKKFVYPYQPEHIQLFLTRVGVTKSKEHAFGLIKDGAVKVDDVVLQVKDNFKVQPNSKVEVNGKVIPIPQPKLWIHNKREKTYITNLANSKGDDLLTKLQKALRLPYITRIGGIHHLVDGLLLITNCGPLQTLIDNCESKIEKVYRVSINGPLTHDFYDGLQNGVKYKNGDVRYYGVNKMEFEIRGITNAILKVTTTRNTDEIYELCKYFKVTVKDIIRIGYGPYTLPKDLLPSKVMEVEINADFIDFLNKNKKVNPNQIKK